MKNPICPVCGSKIIMCFGAMEADTHFEFINGKPVLMKVTVNPYQNHGDLEEIRCSKNYEHLTDDKYININDRVKMEEEICTHIRRLSKTKLTLSNKKDK
jgi:hypothetical protein